MTDRAPARFWSALLATTGGWIAIVVWLLAKNPRLIASWHGFLHTGIAMRFPSPTWIPENPFLAGQPIAYYWFYQRIAHSVSAVAGADPLHVFQGFAIAGLAAVMIAGGLLGRALYRSTAAAVMVGTLAVVGTNPAAPLIAGAKHLLRGDALIAHDAPPLAEQIFVTDSTADARMSQPLLSAMHVGADWRLGQNLPWFFDVSSRGPALALVMVGAYLVLVGGQFSWLALVPNGFLMTALNPLVGLAAIGALFGAACLAWAYTRRSEANTVFAAQCARTSLMLAGALIAAPTFIGLAGGDVAQLSSLRHIALKVAALAAGFSLLAPLAARAIAHADQRIVTPFLAGALLIVAVPFAGLAEGNEHNLVNVASCLFAIPAAGWVALERSGTMTRTAVRALALTTLLVPATVATLIAFDGRPLLPLAFDHGRLRHLPLHGSVDAFFDWAASTPQNAVLLADPRRPLKMSGNVSEIPAFSGRTLFIDQPTYMTASYRDAALRRTIATRALDGEPLTREQALYLTALHRPLYLVSYDTASPETMARLEARWGAPVYRNEFAAAFAMTALNAGAGPGSGDPIFATFLGGDSDEEARDVAIDFQGNIFVTGGTGSRNFPTTDGTKLNTAGKDEPGIDQVDVYVARFGADGQLMWSTLLGGPNHDRAYAIETDNRGNVYVAGRAGRGFPVTNAAFQRSFQGGKEADVYGPQDGFVCKLTANNGTVVFCSYFGGTDYAIVRDVAVDGRGDIYLASGYVSGSYPAGVREKFINKPRGGKDAVLAKVKGDGTAVIWATYLGGSGDDSNQNSVRIDGADAPYILFTTLSTNVATPGNAFARKYSGNGDMFVSKLSPTSGKQIWGTYIGGSGNESTETHEFAVDRNGFAYVSGPTTSTNFPTTPGALQRVYGGGTNDAFVAKLSQDGTRLVASTYIGGRGADRAEGVAVDDNGVFYFTGTTTSNNFPVTPDALQPSLHGARDAIAVKLAPDFSHLLYSTYVGGSGDEEYGRGAAVGPDGEFLVVGQTPSGDFPSLNAAQRARRQGSDAFVVKFE